MMVTAEDSRSVTTATIKNDQAEFIQDTMNNEGLMAFYRGLGLTDMADLPQDSQSLYSLGQCLKTCIDKVQTELLDIQKLFGRQSGTDEHEDVVALMFSLHKQGLLMPNELISQLHDEVAEHQKLYLAGMKAVLRDEIHTHDPDAFARDHKARFMTDGRLWKLYTERFAQYKLQHGDMSDRIIESKIIDKYSKLKESI
ncbi:hypothetical protein N9R79_12625 [Vibrio sp.]|nr:hypothetical protein [Vibrio sp.]